MNATTAKWITLREAADSIGCAYVTAQKYVKRKVLRARYPLGRGPGKPVEVSMESVLALKAQNKAATN